MNNITKMSLSAITAALLTGCVGGGGGPSTPSIPTVTPPPLTVPGDTNTTTEETTTTTEETEETTAEGITTEETTTEETTTEETTTEETTTEETIDPKYNTGTPTIVDQTNIYSAEYYSTYQNGRDGFLQRINAGTAYEQGWTGEGVTVGVVDSGIDTDHTDLDDNIVGVYSLLDYDQNAIDGEDDYKHGTMAAGIIAAEKNDAGMHGVAYDADIISVKVLNSTGYGNATTVANGVLLAADNGADVVNVSISGIFAGVSATTVNNTYNTVLANDVSVIVAAGNNGTKCARNNSGYLTGCGFPAALPVTYPELLEQDGAFISVGSVDDDGVMTSYSNTAGLTQDWFMVAPESGYTRTTYNDGAYTSLTVGTSFAAPMVAGAYALLKQKYPYLIGSEIAEILFASAVDLGAAGVDEIYGHGMLDVDAAMAPIGDLNIPTAASVSGASVPVTNTGLVSGAGINLSAASLTVVALDDFDRAYKIDMSGAEVENANRYDVDKFSTFKYNNTIIGLNTAEQTALVGYDFEMFSTKFSYENNVFGSEGSGATEVSGRTYYASIASEYNGFGTEITYGYSNPEVGGIFKDSTAIHGLGTKVYYKNKGFQFGVKTPMTVMKGSIKYETPTMRAASGELVTEQASLDLKGEVRYQAFFSYNMIF